MPRVALIISQLGQFSAQICDFPIVTLSAASLEILPSTQTRLPSLLQFKGTKSHSTGVCSPSVPLAINRIASARNHRP